MCKLSFFAPVSSGVLALVMGMRFKNSGKLLPAGLMAVLRSESNYKKSVKCLSSLDQFYRHWLPFYVDVLLVLTIFSLLSYSLLMFVRILFKIMM